MQQRQGKHVQPEANGKRWQGTRCVLKGALAQVVQADKQQHASQRGCGNGAIVGEVAVQIRPKRRQGRSKGAYGPNARRVNNCTMDRRGEAHTAGKREGSKGLAE